MKRIAESHSCEELLGEDQLLTTQPQKKPKEADMEKAIIKQKEIEENEGKDGDEVAEKDLVYEDEVTDTSDEESIDPDDLPEYTPVDINKARKLLRCKLCQGTLRKIKQIKACTHRFCGECIDKWLELGKKECPLCWANCPSSDAIEDHHFDGIVAVFLPHIEELEAQELELNKEDKSCKDQQDECMSLKDNNCTTASSCSNKSQSILLSSQSSPRLSKEMFDRVAKQVVPAILKHKKTLQWLRTPDDE